MQGSVPQPMNGAEFKEKRIAAEKIVSRLAERGHTALFAGGYVRDKLLGHAGSADIDIATSATPDEVMALFSSTIPVGAKFGVVIVVYSGIPFEVATFRADLGIGDGRHPESIAFADAREDALRRDFTINGMFYDPLTDRVIDYVSGEADLRLKIVRAIGDPKLRFREDYLRLLRAIRFAARFDFSIDSATLEAVIADAPGIAGVSAERIFSELDRMLRQPHPDRAFRLLLESGLLHHTLPEVDDLVGVEQPPEFHPEGDVFEHTIKALGLLDRADAPAPSAILAWSVLLHDIGKKATMRRLDRIRFNNHDQVGADLSGLVLRRLRAPNELIDGVAACIGNHMNFMNVTAMRLSTLKKLLSRPTIADELELHRIDCLASHGNIDNFYFVKDRLAAFAQEVIKPAPLLRGADLLGLGYRPGPKMGEILREVYDLQLDETIRTRDEAVEYVKSRWPIE